MKLSKYTLFFAGAGIAVAQSLSGQCTAALLTIASTAACLDLSLLEPLITSIVPSTSAIPTVNNWLNGMCSRGPCSNSTLQTVVTDLLNGCSTDLTRLNLTITDPTTVVTTAQAAYSSVRQIACLKDTSTNTLCVAEVLNAFRSTTGIAEMSLLTIASLISQVSAGKPPSVPQSIACTDCVKAAYIILDENFPSIASSAQSAFQRECGSSFTDGQMPSDIQETATSAATSLGVNNLNVGTAVLVAITSAFALFA